MATILVSPLSTSRSKEVCDLTRPTTSTASASKARRSKWTAMPALVSPSRTTSMLASMGQPMASSVKPSSASSVTWPVATAPP